ncbi:MAG TPA: magnesium/cobalt efflux protein, partial [Pseudomonas sp.]|nr:magnesium/cobalt efflux protein [Pseudomonas sp.]
EALEHIPDSGICLQINQYRLEILQAADNRVKSVRAWVIEAPEESKSDTQ